MKIWAMPKGNEMVETIKTGRADLIVFAMVDTVQEEIFLSMADGSIYFTEFSRFKPSGVATPDFFEPEVRDSGMTLGLGEYEASSRSALMGAELFSKPEGK